MSVLDKIYSTEKKIAYNICFFQHKQNLKTNETIYLTLTGKKWKQSESQLEAIWTYRTKPGTEKKFQNQFSIGWISADTTGIIEDEEKIFIHPPRHNQYTLTEIAPFPDFRKNLKIGDTYTALIIIGPGWGDWSGKKIKSRYIIEDTRIEKGDKYWTIKATSELDGKTTDCEFIFNEKKGFVSLVYNFFNGDKMTMKLKKIEDCSPL